LGILAELMLSVITFLSFVHATGSLKLVVTNTFEIFSGIEFAAAIDLSVFKGIMAHFGIEIPLETSFFCSPPNTPSSRSGVLEKSLGRRIKRFFIAIIIPQFRVGGKCPADWSM